jgi:hypothetical protein
LPPTGGQFAYAAVPKGWEKDQANIRLSGGRSIRAIYHPVGKTPHMSRDRQAARPPLRKPAAPTRHAAALSEQAALLFANIVDSPPVDGFVPWVVVSVTNARSDSLDTLGYMEPVVTGTYLTPSPETDYAVGIFDTGAAAHVMGYNDSVSTGIYSSGLVTDSVVALSGATGTVEALASYPLGIFVGGLDAIDPNGSLQASFEIRGESNVSIAVGNPPLPGVPDLPTAIGAPLAVFYTTAFDNSHRISRVRDSNEYYGPVVALYEPDDPAIPAFNDSSIPLELRPSGAAGVNYFPTFDYGTLDFYPLYPSVVGDYLFVPQSLFFVATVNMTDSSHSAAGRTKFMLDTGAQVTVVGSVVGSLLALNPAYPDFEVEIQDITGQVTVKPGFYVDTVEMPALGDWLIATNVPVVMMDIASPEGGYLDGIIGMNLFTGFDMVLRGGGMIGQDAPFLNIKLVTNIADIAPTGGDGRVDGMDLEALAGAWLSQPQDPHWNPDANIAPQGGDDIINFRDFAVLAANWGWIRGQ